MSSLNEYFEQSRNDLLDLSLRNNFLNTKDSKSKSVRIINESSIEVFKLLVDKGNKMYFDARRDKISEEQDSEFNALFQLPPIESIEQSSLTDNKLQTNHSPKDLQRRLLSISRNARLSIEEKGINTLFLALGFIRWYEHEKSDSPRIAPTLLIPAQIHRTSINSRFKIWFNEDDITTNISFFKKMRSDFGVEVTPPEDFDIESVTEFYTTIKERITIPRWEFLENEIRLGLFSFHKFLMYSDLDAKKWPDDNKPFQHQVLSSLLGSGFIYDSVGEDESSDDGSEIPFEETYHVLPADSSQQEVIFAIRDGLNTIVQGPPGTGKSQTITNIISDFLARGKKVLFVAEKMAALKVVSNRLNACGLGDLSIELHSDRANKKEFLKEIERVLKLGKPTINIEVDRKLVQGGELRDAVNRYAKAVNQEVEGSGFSPIESFGYIIEAQEKLKGKIYDLSLERIKVGSKENFIENTKLIEDIAKILEKTGSLPGHPFSKFRPKDFTYYDVELFFKKLKRLQKQLAQSIETLKESNKNNSEWTAIKTLRELEKFEISIKYIEESDQPKLKTDFSAKVFEDHDLILKLYELSKDIVILKNHIAKYESQLLDSFWSANITRDYINLYKHNGKWLKFLISSYKKSRHKILSYFIDQKSKKTDAELIAICQLNLDALKLNTGIHNLNFVIRKITDEPFDHYSRRWSEMEALVGWYLGYHQLLEKDTVYQKGLEFVWKPESIHKPGLQSTQLKQLLEEVKQLLASVRYMAPIDIDDVNINQLNEEMKRWIENESSFNQYNQLLKNIEKIEDCDLDWIKEAIEKWDEAPNHIHHLFNYYWFNSIADKALRERTELKYFVGDNHSSAVQNYCEFEDNLLELNKYRARLSHWEGLPNSSLSAGVLGILKSQFAKKRKLKSIRRLISECGKLILDIKPLFLMSPMSVAQFIETDKIQFDLVIFDEASQIRPVEAFGSILRGKQLVVVGDSKQLPPTSFFDLAIEEDDDEEYEDEVATSDVESILSLASAKNMPEKMLRWHYRSKHESLIAISNREFYDSNLLVFPSAFLKTPDRGFYHHHTEGTFYLPGKGDRVNRKEAKIIVAKVFEHARERASQSLGVVAFSKVQARLIQDYIENELRMNPDSAVEQYLYGNSLEEKFFVKNLENVQGDERDVIFISVGYGRQESGKFSYNFGPVSKEGGERRLNVLFSRAKLKCVVFSNFTADEMDLSKTDSLGFKVLRSYLLYAEKREIDSIVINNQEKFDSKFEEQVSNALIKNGFDIQNQVGSQGFWIDIGVKHPVEKGRFILAVECDGAKYHSSKIARDRDKSRQLILEMQGWKFYRIWSTDWFLNTHRETEKLIAYVNGIISEEVPVNRIYHKNGIEINTSYETKEIPLQISNYKKFDELVELLYPLYETSLDALIRNIVEKEQPIHREIVLRRILEITDTARAGSRIQSNFDYHMSQGVIDSDIRSDDDFYYSDDSFEFPSSEGLIRKRSNLSKRESSVKYISPHEIQNAILLLVERSYGISSEEIENEVPRLFGFSRSTDDFRIVIKKELENLQKNERIVLQSDLYLIDNNSGLSL